MKTYELNYLISPSAIEEEIRALQERIASLIQKEDGLLGEINPPIKKELAYPIKKNNIANLAFLNFQMNPQKLANLEKAIKEEPQVLRHLITIKPLLKMDTRPLRRTSKEKEDTPRQVKKSVDKKTELKAIEDKLEEILGK